MTDLPAEYVAGQAEKASKPQKEGLQAAVDFVKYLITVSSAAIAFIIQPTFYGASASTKWLSAFSLALFFVSIFCGLMVHMASCAALSAGNYDLENPHLKYWGRANQLCFGAAFLLLVIGFAVKTFGGTEPSVAAPPSVALPAAGSTAPGAPAATMPPPPLPAARSAQP